MHTPCAYKGPQFCLPCLGDASIPSTIRNRAHIIGIISKLQNYTGRNKSSDVVMSTNLCHFLEHCHWFKNNHRKGHHRCNIRSYVLLHHLPITITILRILYVSQMIRSTNMTTTTTTVKEKVYIPLASIFLCLLPPLHRLYFLQD